MFGGLEVKGGDAKDDSSAAAPAAAAGSGSNSGFSFLQPANTTAVVDGEHQSSSMSLGISGGSAFGFLSGGSTENNNKPPPPSAAAVPSMFAGLNNNNTPINNSSDSPSYSATEAPQAPHHLPSSSGSGFSFLSSSSSSITPPMKNNSVEIASNVSTAGSSFSFMNSMISNTENGESTANKTDVVDDTAGFSMIGDTNNEGSTTAAAPVGSSNSGFSFLSGPPTNDSNMASHSSSLIPQIQPSSRGGSSMFTGLNTVATETHTENNDTVPPPPPPPAADSDLFSTPSPVLSAASGVSWGAPPGVGGAKKIVKKKRGVRVGVGSATAVVQQPTQQPMVATASSNHVTNVGMTNSMIPAPEQPTSFQSPSPSLTTDTSYHQPTSSNHHAPMYQSSPTASQIQRDAPPPQLSPPMRVKAEMAMQNAEEFIKEKQRSAIAMAAERAMNEKASSSSSSSTSSSVENGSGWKISPMQTPSYPKDSEYQAAMAAAEEARTLTVSKGKSSLFSGVSGFFGRKSPNISNNDAASSISSYSSHGGVVNNIIYPVQRTNSHPSASSLSPTKEDEEHPNNTDPIQRENDEARRAAAERDMAMFRQNQMQEQERLQRVAEEKRRQKEEENKKQLEQERLRQLEEEAKRRSPKEKMQAALDHFADVTRRSTDYVTQLRAKRAELVKERMEAEKTKRFAAQQISYAETQQTQAAEDEDFEAADRLASDIERHTLEKNKQTEIVKSIDDAISQIEKQREAASKAVVACFSDINSKLKELQAEVDNRKREDEVLNQFANTSKRLSSETERLGNDLKHIERDESVLADEQRELESQISEETKEFEEKRVQASEKLEVVDKEIEELRKKLAEAETKAAALNKEISSHNDSIRGVRTKYSRQIGRLEKKERSVKESRAEWQAEQESVEKAKAAHESVVAAHSEEMLTREKLIEEIKFEVSAAHDFEGIVSSAFEATEFIGDDNQEFDSDVLKYEAAVDEANNNVISAESKIQSLQDEISAFDVRVPILEAEKKVAAAKRDFKAAGKASKEIKDALARKEQCEAELSGEAMERKQAAKGELQKVTLLLEEKKSIAAEKGKEAGLKRMETLRERIASLQCFVKESGVDSGDSDSINVACVGAFVIDSQISVLEAEGKALGEKYGGWASDAVEYSSNAVGDAIDRDDAPSDSVIDDDTLLQYATLTAEIEELEAKIEQAALDEDYDNATALEERAESLRSKINSLGHSPEKIAQALKNKSTVSSIPDEGVLDKYASLKAEVEQLEADIGTAVAAENFDGAAELEEKVQVLKTEIESLGFPVDDLEEALKNGLNINGDDAETDTKANGETADANSQKPSDDVDVIEEEAHDTNENDTPNGTETS